LPKDFGGTEKKKPGQSAPGMRVALEILKGIGLILRGDPEKFS
jgi:hypothetical protein